MTANPNLAPASRAERAVEAARLKAEGLNGIQIAERMGVSRSYAYDLLNDPAGDRDRARKASYRGECIDCGAATTGCNGRDRAPDRCLSCTNVILRARGNRLRGERRRSRWDLIARMYRAGEPLQTICTATGLAIGTIGGELIDMREAGYDLPHRRRTYAGEPYPEHEQVAA